MYLLPCRVWIYCPWQSTELLRLRYRIVKHLLLVVKPFAFLAVHCCTAVLTGLWTLTASCWACLLLNIYNVTALWCIEGTTSILYRLTVVYRYCVTELSCFYIEALQSLGEYQEQCLIYQCLINAAVLGNALQCLIQCQRQCLKYMIYIPNITEGEMI